MGDKTIRVSMLFEKTSVSRRNSGSDRTEKPRSTNCDIDPLDVVAKARSWIAKRGKGVFKTNAEIARIEGITRARVSQLLPVGRLTDQQIQFLRGAADGAKVSIRALIRAAKNLR
jgi:hypothetical protein